MTTRLTTQQIMANAMLEKDLVRHIVKAAKDLGYMVTHFTSTQTEGRHRTALQGDKGFPDLVIANGRVVLFVECKSQVGRMSPEQHAWMAVLRVTGVDGPVKTYEWRPMNWLDGSIGKVLVQFQ